MASHKVVPAGMREGYRKGNTLIVGERSRDTVLHGVLYAETHADEYKKKGCASTRTSQAFGERQRTRNRASNSGRLGSRTLLAPQIQSSTFLAASRGLFCDVVPSDHLAVVTDGVEWGSNGAFVMVRYHRSVIEISQDTPALDLWTTSLYFPPGGGDSRRSTRCLRWTSFRKLVIYKTRQRVRTPKSF
ncbi:hypothetical protein BC834DRAFT_658317 [Gloeopeniophorella convolvens]|nr:hypothetical protein BC834DRAFT_658317 [Gloeopeniophorella convolvens]